MDARDQDKARAEKALAIFSEIYIHERAIKEAAAGDADMRKELRLQKVLPLLEEIKTWIQEEQFKVLPKTAMGKAMTYFINQYLKFEVIFEDGRIELDNNQIENAIRPLAIGRKNYLFAGSHNVAQRAAGISSFFAISKKTRGKSI